MMQLGHFYPKRISRFTSKVKTGFPIWPFFIAAFGFMACNQGTELTWNEEDGYRWSEVSAGYFESVGFQEVSASTSNITFENRVHKDSVQKNRHYLNGSGVAAADINNDGLVDLYFASLSGQNKLYQNMGNRQFKDITEESGTALEHTTSTGVVFADVNNDQLPDLLVTSLNNRNQLLINEGNNQFRLQENSGLGAAEGATTLALADVNSDGWIDLYITNYKKRTVRDLYGPQELSMANTVEQVDGKLTVKPDFKKYYQMVETAGQTYRNEIGQKDELYINNRDGSFNKVDPINHFFDQNGKAIGLDDDWGLTARFHDVNGDNLPDLYVANDFWSPDRFWINKGDGQFWKADSNAIRNSSFAAMGIDFSDINRDGYTDFMVTEMLSTKHSDRIRQYSEILEAFEGSQQNNRNSVYLNRGDNTYAEIAQYSQLEASGWSWGTHFLDVDLDGYEDLFIANGFGFDYQDMDTQLAMRQADESLMPRGGDILKYPPLPLRNKLFKNRGDLTFREIGQEWGFTRKDIAQGVTLADIDNDGDLDIITNRYNEQAGIYINKASKPRIAVRLKGNASLIAGAEIVLEGGQPRQSKTISTGGSYVSGLHHQAVFAANGASDYTIIVQWADGSLSRIDEAKENRLYEVNPDLIARSEPVIQQKNNTNSLFEDVSVLLNHTHKENIYDDFKFGPLLPHKLSEQGPGLAWIDINSDGMDDLFITGSKNGNMGIFRNQNNGTTFRQIAISPITDTAAGDQTALAAWKDAQGVNLLIGSANYEQGNPRVASAFVYTIQENGNIAKVTELPGILSTTGPVAAADYTGDGNIDLFLGGSFEPGQYPKDATSRLFINENDGFAVDRGNQNQLKNIGLVTDALFADFTNNGWQDLLISTEWGSLKLFENRSGRFTEITEDFGLADYRGWWRGISVGDVTGNGLPDIVASNVGHNSFYQLSNDKPLRLYYGDLNNDGRLDIVDSYYSPEIDGYVPRRKLHDFGSIPNILQNVRSHKQFAASTVDKIFNRNFEQVPKKEINTLSSMVFLNRKGTFQARSLPKQAQLSAATFTGVADINNDGANDIFIGQNYFGFPHGFSRQDAGRGLFLLGDNTGQFRAVPGQDSGILIYGEQRGVAFGDFNKDGKIDLAVGQNDGPTKLYKNRTDSEGYRITLVGEEENRWAIGSTIRIVYSDSTKGAATFISAGSGYRSQNSTTKVLGYNKDKVPVSFNIAWYDGTTGRQKITKGKKSYTIRY